ncbi:hypothetical protein [Ornithinimicrobium avium]|uniref:Uncharacterized protein n=1 Tax=Ornithinimicrobium avium TaxID=2283195 RepID=A0A345NLP4_9MICO|nr:hypothetical protein [Ornithinimicrobium avium]AXH95952.1 hypothetical protein DV701_07265 [Ornithinimicrobium avium]
MSDTTPQAARVLVQMHQLLRQAGAEAYRRARQSLDLDTVALASNLTYACDLVFHLVPEPYRDALVDGPEVDGADPVELARRAEELSRTAPVNHFPPGMVPVVEILIETVREFS